MLFVCCFRFLLDVVAKLSCRTRTHTCLGAGFQDCDAHLITPYIWCSGWVPIKNTCGGHSVIYKHESTFHPNMISSPSHHRPSSWKIHHDPQTLLLTATTLLVKQGMDGIAFIPFFATSRQQIPAQTSFNFAFALPSLPSLSLPLEILTEQQTKQQHPGRKCFHNWNNRASGVQDSAIYLSGGGPRSRPHLPIQATIMTTVFANDKYTTTTTTSPARCTLSPPHICPEDRLSYECVPD